MDEGGIAVIEAIRRRLAKIIMLASNDPDEKTKFNAWIVRRFREAWSCDLGSYTSYFVAAEL